MNKKVVVTCALTGVLTDPERFRVPVTPDEMAAGTQQAYDAGASVVHCHFRDQREGMGALPTWDLETVGSILAAIKDMPAAAGNALGMDRLTMLFADTKRIDDVVAFTPEAL